MKVTLDGIRDVKIYQSKDGYRFSIDALLLSSFVNVRHVRAIADLGAGSGIIGLLLARRYRKADVLLVELQKSLFRLAEKNILINKLEGRVSAMLADINDIKKQLSPLSFDVVVSNPPFRRPRSGRISEATEKAVARHEIRLRLTGLVESASYLLRARGRFFMIFHPERILEMIDTLRLKRLEPKRLRFVHNDAGAESKMVLIEAVKEGRTGIKIEKPLFIYKKPGSYSDEVRNLYEWQ